MAELSIILKYTARDISITGIHIIIQEFKKNLNLITSCLINPLIVSQKFETVSDMLFITASRAEQSLSTI